MAWKQVYESGNRNFCLDITIKTNGKKRFRIWAEDYGKSNSKYADREIEVNGERTIFFSFPVTPKQLFVGCVNSENPADRDYTVELTERKLRKYGIWMDEQTSNFLDVCIPFCQLSGFTEAGPSPKIKQKGEFSIAYYDVIRDKSGSPMGTPARIGHSTGKIDVSKAKFDKYTIPMRVIIMLHEYSHKYRNPKMNLEIGNEVGADINALYIYLGLGFSKIDAICVFSKVFLNAQSEENMKRIRKINEYIDKFEANEYAKVS